MQLVYSNEQVYENIKVTEGIYKLTIKGSFSGNPGQFYMLRAWEREPVLSRPISIHDINNDSISFLYQVVGEGTRIFSRLKPGDDIKVMGPLGRGFDAENIKGKVAIVAGGMGTAPMFYTAKKLQHCDVDAYYGFRDTVHSIEELSKIVNNVYISTENGIYGTKGYVTDILPVDDYDMVLCCGPEVMMKKVVKMCREKKVPVMVSMEKSMACGIGACLCCTCKTKYGNMKTCKDGPVFSGEDLIFE